MPRSANGVYGDDPTVKALERATAQLLVKEDAVYMPTGTMTNQVGCPYQKLRPTVLVVQATEDGHRNDPPDTVDRSMDWSVFVQRQVSPELVVIRDVGCDDAAEMSLAEHDEMIETLPSDRADQPFDVSVLPR
jgi:hypothetical protein